MKRRVHRRLYERFEPMERLRLATEARARGDEEEYEHLRATCPTERFEAEVRVFADPWHASADLAMFMVQVLQAAVSRLQEIEVAEQLVGDWLLHLANEAVDQFAKGVRHGDPTCDLEEKLCDEILDKAGARTLDLRGRLLKVLSQRKEQVVAETGAIYAAFCCVTGEKLGLEGEMVLRAHVGDEIDHMRLACFEAAALEASDVSHYEQELRSVWETMVG